MSSPALVDEALYRELLAETAPHIIHTEEENNERIRQLEALHDRGNLSPEERELSELLTLLIEDFESEPTCSKRSRRSLSSAS